MNRMTAIWEGQLWYVTRPLSMKKAKGYAALIQEIGMITWIVPTGPDHLDRYQVHYRREEDVRDIYKLERAKRASNAMRDMDDWTWSPLREGVELLLTRTGGPYEVTEAECTCEDYLRRCKAVGLPCKHIIGRRLR